jgi:hypothetical protein
MCVALVRHLLQRIDDGFRPGRVLASRDYLRRPSPAPHHRRRRWRAARAARRCRRRCAAEYRAGADGGRLFLAEDLARYRLDLAGELVHVGDGKTG